MKYHRARAVPTEFTRRCPASWPLSVVKRKKNSRRTFRAALDVGRAEVMVVRRFVPRRSPRNERRRSQALP